MPRSTTASAATNWDSYAKSSSDVLRTEFDPPSTATAGTPSKRTKWSTKPLSKDSRPSSGKSDTTVQRENSSQDARKYTRVRVRLENGVFISPNSCFDRAPGKPSSVISGLPMEDRRREIRPYMAVLLPVYCWSRARRSISADEQ